MFVCSILRPNLSAEKKVQFALLVSLEKSSPSHLIKVVHQRKRQTLLAVCFLHKNSSPTQLYKLVLFPQIRVLPIESMLKDKGKPKKRAQKEKTSILAGKKVWLGQLSGR